MVMLNIWLKAHVFSAWQAGGNPVSSVPESGSPTPLPTAFLRRHLEGDRIRPKNSLGDSTFWGPWPQGNSFHTPGSLDRMEAGGCADLGNKTDVDSSAGLDGLLAV